MHGEWGGGGGGGGVAGSCNKLYSMHLPVKRKIRKSHIAKNRNWSVSRVRKHCVKPSNTVVSNHFHSVKFVLFSSARSRDFDGMLSAELLVSMYTTQTPIDMCRFNVRSST